MSHFNILVVGDVDYQMAPFHEYECDGINDEFIENVDMTQEAIDEYKEWVPKLAARALEEGKPYKKPTLLEFIQDWYGKKPVLHSITEINTNKEDQKWGYILVDKNNRVKTVVRRTNPNSFYDYYTYGWKGLLLKERGANGEEQWVNHAYKSEVDFDSIFERNIREAKARYRKALALLGYDGDNYPTIEHTWASLCDKFSPRKGEPTMTKAEAEEIYDNQEIVKKWDSLSNKGKIEEFGIWCKVDDFCMSEEDYLKSQSVHALTFGFVYDREYTSNGDMGWWAMVSNEKEPTYWDDEYREFLNSLPDNAELSIVNCHV